MKGLLYYFSGTGNTKWAAEVFKKEFEKLGKELDIKNIEETDNIDLKGYNYLIIGTPVHAEFPPRMVMDFVNKLPENDKSIKCIVYSTQGANKSAATEYIKRQLEKKGYEVLAQASLRFANNYYFGVGVLRSEEEITRFCSKAEVKIKLIAEKFLKGEQFKEKSSGFRVFIGKISYNGFNKMLPKLSASLTSTSECSKCGLCLRNCPKGNITFEDGHAIFHSKCIMCTRCIHLCPINAIRYKGKKINQIQRKMIKSLELK
ncbi:4Fe-4S binding domain protein [Clostridiales bacterium oral taxon 876 str. F0540]|nr:4Fe-4S binding domain protein [Clostridiales bacterium oral taxon 876 str. F0540]